MKIIEGPNGVVREQVLYNNLEQDTGLDMSNTILLSSEVSDKVDGKEKYPMQVRYTDKIVVVYGLTVFGKQDRNIDWKQLKADYDGDGLRMETTGYQIVENMYSDNAMDGFSTAGTKCKYWQLCNSWFRHTRDDAIENDSINPGMIDNCLFDGTYVFYSTRPGKNDTRQHDPIETVIRDSLIWLKPMPNSDPKSKYWTDGPNGEKLCSGSLFKDSEHSGSIIMEDCVIRMDQVHARGPGSAMEWPEGTYNNVSLIWLGEGDYPKELPNGVTVYTDPALWFASREKWIKENGHRFLNRSLQHVV